MKNNAELWGAIYRKLQEIDKRKKFKKTIDPHQVLLEECIARKLKEIRNDNKQND